MIYEGGRPTPGKDDGLVISLLRTNTDIQTYFRHTGHLLPNQLTTNLRLEVDCGKLAYYDWVRTSHSHSLCSWLKFSSQSMSFFIETYKLFCLIIPPSHVKSRPETKIRNVDTSAKNNIYW